MKPIRTLVGPIMIAAIALTGISAAQARAETSDSTARGRTAREDFIHRSENALVKANHRRRTGHWPVGLIPRRRATGRW